VGKGRRKKTKVLFWVFVVTWVGVGNMRQCYGRRHCRRKKRKERRGRKVRKDGGSSSRSSIKRMGSYK